jgi:hypothetical protein
VFCSYRSVDRPAVEDFARRLRECSVDAWLDLWEIAAGDDIMARMDQGVGAGRRGRWPGIWRTGALPAPAVGPSGAGPMSDGGAASAPTCQAHWCPTLIREDPELRGPGEVR